MSHVTAIYAEWSGKINSQRYQLLSDAQSRMGEAINNMRTVRAVSSEEHESKLNDGTLDKCLQIGVRDACVRALSRCVVPSTTHFVGVLLASVHDGARRE